MKTFLLFVSLLIGTTAFAQVVDNNSPKADTLEFDTDTIAFHYPYFGTRIPPFFGIVGGYEGFNNPCWEAGVIFHMADYNSDNAWGSVVGFAATFKKSLKNDLKTIEAEAGIYTPLSIGVGLNANFYQGTRTIGFRPFLGTSWYHLQILAGYNFFSKRQNDLAEIDHFALKIRYVIPVARIYKATIPNPGNNY